MNIIDFYKAFRDLSNIVYFARVKKDNIYDIRIYEINNKEVENISKLIGKNIPKLVLRSSSIEKTSFENAKIINVNNNAINIESDKLKDNTIEFSVTSLSFNCSDGNKRVTNNFNGGTAKLFIREWENI